MGHTKDCPANREEYKKRNKRHHAHTVEDEEPPTKMIKEQIEDYVLISALSGSVSPGEDTWLIDSGASLALQKRSFSRKLHLEMIINTLSKE